MLRNRRNKKQHGARENHKDGVQRSSSLQLFGSADNEITNNPKDNSDNL